MNRVRAAVLTLLVALGAVAPASASTWSTPRPLFGEGESRAYAASLASGGVIAVRGSKGTTEAAIRPSGGSFGAPFAIAAPDAHPYRVFTGPSGDVAVLYSGGAHSNAPNAVALRSPNGEIHQANLPSSYGYVSGGYDAAGNFTTVGPGSAELGGGIGVVTYARDGSVVAARRLVDDGDYYGIPGVAVARDGAITVAWSTSFDPGEGRVVAATAPPGGDFGEPQTVATHARAHEVRLDTDGHGDTLVVWTGDTESRTPNLGGGGRLHASFRPAGEGWRIEPIPGDPTIDVFFNGWSFAMNRAGDAVLAWSGMTTLDTLPMMTYRPAGGRFETVTVAPDLGMAEAAAIGPGGDAVVLDPFGSGLDAVDHPSGRAFLAPQSVYGELAQYPAAAVDADGTAVALFSIGPSDPKRLLTSSHRIGDGPPAASALKVIDFRLRNSGGGALRAASVKPAGFSYRISRAARVRIRIARIGAHGKVTRIATLLAVLHKGESSSPLSVAASRQLARGGRFRARIVAIGRAGGRSKVRTLTFSTRAG